MLKLVRISILFIALVHFLPTLSYGQAAMTPFSYLGIGEYYGNALAHNQGMAGVGISNPQYYFLNNQNPALLVFNRFTVFEGGFIGERRTVRGNGLTESNGNANLNYLALGPVLDCKLSPQLHRSHRWNFDQYRRCNRKRRRRNQSILLVEWGQHYTRFVSGD
jgi:hypothetical protein